MVSEDKNNINKLIEWARSIFKHDCNSTVMVQMPWSVVIKLDTDNKTYYLKQTPPGIYIEAQVLDIINKNTSNILTPKVLHRNSELHCFIMESCGNHSLRTKFDGDLDTYKLISGLESYITIQRDLEGNTSDLLNIGVPDWRVKNFPKLYQDLLSKKDMLIDEGLTEKEIDKLVGLVPKIEGICKEFDGYSIKDTLVNCDFNENNMIIDESSQKISIIDWGESVITHPFFSIASIIHNLARRYELENDGDVLQYIKNTCLSNWQQSASESELEDIYNNILKLIPIYLALSLYRLQDVTNNKSKEQQRWFIRGHLELLLEDGL